MSCGLNAHSIGKQTTAGALQGTQQNPQKAEQAAEQLGKGAAKGLAEGLTAELGKPATQAQLRKTMSSVVAGAIDGALRPVKAKAAPPAHHPSGAADTVLPGSLNKTGAALRPAALESDRAGVPLRTAALESGAGVRLRTAALASTRTGATAPSALTSSGIGRLSDQAGSAFAHAFTRELTMGLGPNGDGPLARAMAGAVGTVTAGAFKSAGAELQPILARCQGADPSVCIGEQVRNLSRQAGAGFAAGVRAELGWAPLILAFLIGVGVALVLALLIVTVRRRPTVTAPRGAQLSPAHQH